MGKVIAFKRKTIEETPQACGVNFQLGQEISVYQDFILLGRSQKATDVDIINCSVKTLEEGVVFIMDEYIKLVERKDLTENDQDLILNMELKLIETIHKIKFLRRTQKW